MRISVPNCAPTDLVMWVFCTSGRTEDPYTWKYYEFDFIRFVVMRGLNLDPTSHGLIGKPLLISCIIIIIFFVFYTQVKRGGRVYWSVQW